MAKRHWETRIDWMAVDASPYSIWDFIDLVSVMAEHGIKFEEPKARFYREKIRAIPDGKYEYVALTEAFAVVKDYVGFRTLRNISDEPFFWHYQD